MPTTLRNTDILFNDSTTQSSGRGVAKAWVRFYGSNGTTISTFNVSSVTRIGTGQYTIAFTALTDSNYIVSTGVSSGTIGSGDNVQGSARFYTNSSSSVTVATILGNGTAFTDGGEICVALMR